MGEIFQNNSTLAVLDVKGDHKGRNAVLVRSGRGLARKNRIG